MYWFSTTHPYTYGGATAFDYENYAYSGHGKYTPGAEISIPVSSTAMLNFSGFITKGTSSAVLSLPVDLFSTGYTAGELVTSSYTIRNYKASLADLLFPFPRKEDQRWRLKTLWEVQYVAIKTGFDAPYAPTVDDQGNQIITTAGGTRSAILPTFGLGAEYHLSRNLLFQINGSGFGIPHHAVIGDAEATLGYRFGPLELIIADKYYHFKTSPQNVQYFRTTLMGPYGALRWYPSKFSVPCPWCAKNTNAQNTTAQTSATNTPPPPGGTLTVPNAGASSSSTAPGPNTYVHRVEGGLTLSVLGFSTLQGGDFTVNTSPSLMTEYQTTNASQRIGYGVTAQVAITDHFAIALQGIFRRVGYKLDTTVTTTTTSATNGIVTTTPTTTSTHDDTRADFIDIPLMLRYFNKDRHTPGFRWFAEGGGAFREAIELRTSESSTDASGNVTCCATLATTRKYQDAKGVTAGGGFQFVDDFGIHVQPEVRYTRWLDPIFDTLSTDTRRNEVAAGLTLSF